MGPHASKGTLVRPNSSVFCAAISRIGNQQSEQCIMSLRKTAHRMHCFGQHGFAHEKGRVQLLNPIDDPKVMLFRPVEESDQRARINDGGAYRDRSP